MGTQQATRERTRRGLRAVLEYLAACERRPGRPPPTRREIAGAVGLAPSTVTAYLRLLDEQGLVQVQPGLARAVALTREGRAAIGAAGRSPWGLPLLGSVAAGMPILAAPEAGEVLPLPPDLAERGDFVLRVQGDSMVGAGIYDGDVVVVRRQDHADDGAIVVALVGDDEVTVKRLSRRQGRVRLLAENPAYPPIEGTEFRVLGTVTALWREY